MIINRDNYELFFVDFLDGKLDEASMEELKLFLASEPDLQVEFDELSDLQYLHPEKISFPLKSEVKKTKNDVIASSGIDHKNIDDYLISFVEGTATSTEVEELNKFFKANPQYKKDLELYKKTKLVPDHNILFAGKSSLKRFIIAKKFSVKPGTIYKIAAAASVAIITGLFLINYPGENTDITNGLSIQKTGLGILPQVNADIKKPDISVVAEENSRHMAVKVGVVKTKTPLDINNIENIQNVKFISAVAAGIPELPEGKHEEKCTYTNNNLSKNYRYIVVYEEEEQEQNNTGQEKEKNTFGEFLFAKIKENINPSLKPDEQNESAKSSITWFDVASLGVDGFNRATGSTINLKGVEGENGKLKGYTLKGDKFRIYRNLKNGN